MKICNHSGKPLISFQSDLLLLIAARAKENMFRGVSALVRRHRRRRRRLRLKSLGQIIALQLFCFGMYL